MEFSLESRIKSLEEVVKIYEARVQNLELSKIYVENIEKKYETIQIMKSNMENWAKARDEYMESKNLKYDSLNQWTDYSKDIPFEVIKKIV